LCWVALMHFSLEPVILLGLVSIIGAVAIVVGATAVMEAVSQTRGNLPTADEALLSVQPIRLSMIVEGRGRMTEPLHLHFTLADPAVALIQIELANPLDREARAAQCVKTASKVFVAEVEPKVVQRWYNANPYWNGETKRLPIRVFMGDGGHAACRTIWVMMSPGTPPDSGPTDVEDFTWLLDGPC